MRKGTRLISGISSSNSPASPTDNGSGVVDFFTIILFKLLSKFGGSCGDGTMLETGL